VAPRSHALPHHHLTFHELAGGALELHRWGMRQPPASQPPVALQQIDVLLVPGLLFDVAGTRLGYGMGYYDRALASGGGPVTVGVTLQALLVPELPRAPHDVAVQYLLTEAGLRRAKPAP
jgi:5-formyltetrahydrofolate cyclo-ligase